MSLKYYLAGLLLTSTSDPAFGLGAVRDIDQVPSSEFRVLSSTNSQPETTNSKPPPHAAENPAAMLGETMGESRPASPQSPALLSPDRFSFLAGGELLHAGGADQWMPALAARYRLEKQPPALRSQARDSLGPGRWSLRPSAIELGGALPRFVTGGFHQETINFGGASYQAHIKSAAEAHLAGVWEFWKQDWIVPELSVGFSVGRFKNEADSPGQSGFPLSEEHAAVSQITQLGATFPIAGAWAFHADAGYVRWSNHLRDPANNDFDLFVSALALRAMLQARW